MLALRKNDKTLPTDIEISTTDTGYGMSRFIQRVYKTHGLSFTGSLLTSQFIINGGLLITSLKEILVIGAVANIVGFAGTLFI